MHRRVSLMHKATGNYSLDNTSVKTPYCFLLLWLPRSCLRARNDINQIHTQRNHQLTVWCAVNALLRPAVVCAKFNRFGVAVKQMIVTRRFSQLRSDSYGLIVTQTQVCSAFIKQLHIHQAYINQMPFHVFMCEGRDQRN